jgi:hypothetical protein
MVHHVRALGLLVVLSSACSFSVRGVEVPVDDGPADAPGAPVPASGDGPLVLADLSQPTPATPDASSPDLASSGYHVGDACNGSCGATLFCMGWSSGGYCSRPCLSGSDCPGDAACVDIGAGVRMCMLRRSGEECTRDSLQCRDCGGTDVCAPSSFCKEC